MSLVTEIGLGPGHTVLDGDPAQLPPPKKGAQSPIFGPCLLWPNGWMVEGRTQPRPHCIIWGPSSPKKRHRREAPTFLPMSTVAKRSPISATAELLFSTIK